MQKIGLNFTMTSIDVLITSHNRPESLKKCLSSLVANLDARMRLRVFVANSGKPLTPLEIPTDDRVDYFIYQTDSSTYWASGMYKNWLLSQALTPPSELTLLLNEDSFLKPKALGTMLTRLVSDPTAVVVGLTEGPNGELSQSYGGLRRRRLEFWRLEKVKSGVWSPADTMNGNVVLTKTSSLEASGGFPSGFSHSRADLVLGFRMRRCGFRLLQTPEPVAVCKRNNRPDFYSSRRGQPIGKIWRDYQDPLVGPWIENAALQRYLVGLFLLPFFAVAPLIRIAACALSRRDSIEAA